MTVKTLAGEKTMEVVHKATTKDENEKKMLSLRSNIVHFLIDFDIISYTIAFIIAFQFQNFSVILLEYAMKKIMGNKKNELLSSFLSFMITLTLCFIFIQYIFFKFIYTDDMEKESIFKEAISEKKKEKAMVEVLKEPDTKKEIEKTELEGNKNKDDIILEEQFYKRR